ncbi:protein kinase domain-containing protein [Nocardioides taihuensis]|uniref:BTAD domain-containing putative transcriptional regulator n=1 Tax=Nocardioides taihuensis TaxID=1835606 RepID=A0ABW0BDP5_9ACTN
MEFRLLGPLEAEGRDGAISLGGRKQRTVLAHLLIRVNRVVATDRLIDLVWDDDPPPAVRNVLQTYVSRLRKGIGPERLVTRHGGYVLLADPSEIDAEAFTTLVEHARTSTPIDADEAVLHYRRAEALWRGSALEDLADQPSLRSEIARLDELRMTATEERIVVELALGRHRELVAELEALTTAHPLREALWAQLMTALYRSGRQSEALATYRRARTHLVRELGLEPSADLKRLEQRILDQDPALDSAGIPVRGLRLLERIGEGSFGVVHRASQPQVGRDVAVKVVRPRFANDPAFIRRFEVEARLVARLEHPRIVPLYDFWREPSGAFLVMRLLRGGSLRDVLAQGPLPADQALAVVEHVGAALATAHRNGVVHRDVKPANILFDEERNAYLSDFGIARGLDQLREDDLSPVTGSSVHYLSPEEVRGETPTERADIYRLGLVLFEMLTGQHPWELAGTANDADGRADDLPSLASLRPDLPPGLETVVRRATCSEPADRYADVPSLVDAVVAALRATPSPDLSRIPAHNPYKGLRPFEEPDAADFFGREHLVCHLVERLADESDSSRIVALVGPSGSGKSSVVHAGLVPAMRAGAVSGSERWLVAEMTPGAHPFVDLAAAFLALAPTVPPRDLFEGLERGGEALLAAVEWLLPDDGSRLLLVIDQFEGVFTDADEVTRSRFLAALDEAAATPGGRLRVVLTLRADFLDRPLAHSGFASHLRSGTELVVALTPEELERSIAGPAERAGLVLEPSLVARLVSDVHDQPGGLPLLQFALAELVDGASTSTLSLAAYADLGGVAGAVARGAEETYASLSPRQQDRARQLFLRLVQRGDGARPTRRRVLRAELGSLADDPAEMDQVVDAFVRRRLLSLDRDTDSRAPTVELAHESLLDAWARLEGWVEDAQDDLVVQRRLARAVRDWREASGEPSFLAAGARLELFESWRARTDLGVTPEEDAFLRASAEQRDRLRAEDAARQQRERSLERRSLRRSRYLVGALTAGVLVAGALVLLAVDQRHEAERARRDAVTRELAAAAVANIDVDPERSVLLALAAVEESRAGGGGTPPEVWEALHRAVLASRIVLRVPGLGGALDWSPHGDLFVTEGPEESGLVDVRDAATGESVRSFRGHDGDVNLAVFSDDGSLLATSGDDGAVRVWDPRTGRELQSLEGPPGQVWGVSFSPDGSLVAASHWESGVVRVWEVSTGDLVSKAGGLLPSLTTSFSPDGRRLAIGTFGSESVVVDVGTGTAVATLPNPEGGVNGVDWSPDGRWIASSPITGQVRIHDARSGKLWSSLYGHLGPVVATDWSADSARLVTGSGDGTVRVWALNGTGGRQVLSIPVQERGGGLWVAFSPDGQQVMAGDQEGTAVKVFDVGVTGDAEWTNVDAGAAPLLGFTRDGAQLVTASDDGSIRVWDVRTAAGTTTLRGQRRGPAAVVPLSVGPHGEVASSIGGLVTVRGPERTSAPATVGSATGVADVAWSPDGTVLALVHGNGRVEVVEPQQGPPLVRLDEESGHIALGARFSPDGELLAVSHTPAGRLDPSRAGVTVWSWRDGTVRHTFPGGGRLSFSADASLLAVAPVFGPVRIWDVRTGEEVARFVGHTGNATDVEFAPSGTRVATASADGTVRLWEATTGVEQIMLRGHSGTVTDVAFSADGTKLASASADGLARVWALDPQDLVAIAESSVTRGLSPEECSRYPAAC